VKISQYPNEGRIDIYHRGIVFIDEKKRRYKNLFCEKGLIPQMLAPDDTIRPDPTSDHDLIGVFYFPGEEETFNAWVNIVRKMKQLNFE
jgi:hypothetical protein